MGQMNTGIPGHRFKGGADIIVTRAFNGIISKWLMRDSSMGHKALGIGCNVAHGKS